MNISICSSVCCLSIFFCGLTHWGLVTPYGDRDLGQHWLRQWLVAWRHQTITWTNVQFCGIHLTTILLIAFKVSIHEMSSKIIFLAATKQLYEWYFPSVCPSVCLSHLFDYVPIIVSSWNFQELLPMTKVRSMQKVKVRGQRSRSQRSQPNLTVSGL